MAATPAISAKLHGGSMLVSQEARGFGHQCDGKPVSAQWQLYRQLGHVLGSRLVAVEPVIFDLG